MRDVVIVSAVRTPIGKAPKGTLRGMRADDLAAVVLAEALRRAPGAMADEIDDVILGCATPELEQGMDLARLAALRAGFPQSVPGVTVNRFCASGLEAIAIAAGKIASGHADIVLAGGAESMSRVPFMDDATLRKNPSLPESTYLSMGESVERLSKEFGVTRAHADELAAQSQSRAAAAAVAGRFDDEIIPVEATVTDIGDDGVAVSRNVTLSSDEGIRAETTVESLARLKTPFAEGGVITAGNASQRSDGAAAVLLTTAEIAASRGWPVMARFVGYATAAVAPERFGIAPAYAIPKVLERNGLTIGDIDLIEFNEAFAAQALASQAVCPLPWERTNVNGGAVALGHPLGATGARQTVTLLHEAKRRGARYGVVAMCAALGMGAAGLFAFDDEQ